VVASICVWFAVVVGLGTALGRWRARTGPAWALPAQRVALGVLAAVVLLAAVAARPAGIEDIKGGPFTIDAMVAPLVRQTVASLDVEGPVLVVPLDSQLNEVAKDTIMSNLIVEGLDARVERHGAHYGPRRIVDRWAGPMVWVGSSLPPRKPKGKRLAAASMPQWSPSGYDALAAHLGRRLRAAGHVRLEPWASEQLPRYLAGWVPHACATSEAIRRGDVPLSSLPDGLLLTLFGDRAIASPSLPAGLQAEASTMLGQAPLEVWLVQRPHPAAVDDFAMVRDGSNCARGSGPP
jgi:hypothetical protein